MFFNHKIWIRLIIEKKKIKIKKKPAPIGGIEMLIVSEEEAS